MKLDYSHQKTGFPGWGKMFSNAVVTFQCFLLCKQLGHLLGSLPNSSLCHRTAGLKPLHGHSKGWFSSVSKCYLWNALCQEAHLAELDTYHSWTFWEKKCNSLAKKPCW